MQLRKIGSIQLLLLLAGLSYTLLSGIGASAQSNFLKAYAGEVYSWLTNASGTVRLQQQPVIYFGSTNKTNAVITVDSTQQYKTMDGFGFTLTGGSAA
jgi:glucosylceramidase